MRSQWPGTKTVLLSIPSLLIVGKWKDWLKVLWRAWEKKVEKINGRSRRLQSPWCVRMLGKSSKTSAVFINWWKISNVVTLSVLITARQTLLFILFNLKNKQSSKLAISFYLLLKTPGSSVRQMARRRFSWQLVPWLYDNPGERRPQSGSCWSTWPGWTRDMIVSLGQAPTCYLVLLMVMAGHSGSGQLVFSSLSD